MKTCLPALVEQELDGARVRVVDLAGECHGVGADGLSQLLGQVRCRRQLDDLLVAPLHAAVALVEVHHVAVGVGEDLHLDVARVEHGLLEVHHRVAERRLRLAACRLDGLGQSRGLGHPAHASAAAAGHRLDEQRELHALGGAHQFVDRRRRRRRRQHRQAGRPGGRDRACLVAGQLQHIGAGPDERDTRRGAGRRQIGILREEPVSRIDRVGTGVLGDPDDLVDRQIRADRMARFADLIRLVGLEPVQRVAVLVRIDRDGRDTHLVGSAKRADRDFPAVGNQDFGNHVRTLTPTRRDTARSASTSRSRTAPGSSESAR